MNQITIGQKKIEQAESYLTAFGITESAQLNVAGEGRIATNYIVRTSDGGRYILRSYDLEQGRELGYGKDRLEFEAKILKYVEGRTPVATPALLSPVHGCGQPYLECGSAMIMLYSVLDGKCLEQSQLSKHAALQAGHGRPSARGFARSALKSAHRADFRAHLTPDRIVDPEADKPAEHQVIIHLFHQVPLGPDREQDLQQARSDQAFGRDRGAREIGVKHLKFGIEAGERVIDHLPDLAQRVSRGMRSSRST